MGAWVSGTDDDLKLKYEDTWHSGAFDEVRKFFSDDSSAVGYMKSLRAPSPARHIAISRALNNFSLHAARWVIEDLFLGKLIYSGGDDVLAMVSVDDILPAMFALRCVYSGTLPSHDRESAMEIFAAIGKDLSWIDKGHILLGGKKHGRLLRMMGAKATASAGAVIAHHTTPLQGVLRELRAAEQRAKNDGGRNAFSIALMKRAGGTTHLTASWGFGGTAGDRQPGTDTTPMGLLFRLTRVLATKGVSRRAAYHMLQWLPGLPPYPDVSGARTSVRMEISQYTDLLATNIAYQLTHQGFKKKEEARSLAAGLTSWAVDAWKRSSTGNEKDRQQAQERDTVTGRLHQIITVAEFLAREGRNLGYSSGNTKETAGEGGAQ